MDIEDKIIEPIKISDICVPSDILKECEQIYSNFKKMYDKYAPGKLAFFKFNSTIVNNLEKLIKNGCTDLYKISVYQSYFRNCNNINDIDHKTNKISGKLTSLLEAIGTSKKASSSTLGVKGLFTKKRSCDEKLNECYSYFEKLKNGMSTTINDNRVDTNYVDCMQSFKFLSYNNNEITTQTYKNVPSIPSYVNVMSTFLNDEIKTFNDWYKIQKNFKEILDPKNKTCYYSDTDMNNLKDTYQFNRSIISKTKKDLQKYIKNLNNAYNEFMDLFEDKINKKAKDELIGILNYKKELATLYDNIKNNDRNIRNQFIFSNSSYDFLGKLTSAIKTTRECILSLKEWVSGKENYNNISNISDESSPVSVIPLGLERIINSTKEFLKCNSNQGPSASLPDQLEKYNENITKFNKEFEGIPERVRLLTGALNTIKEDIKDKQKEKAFNNLIQKVSAIGFLVGIPLGLLKIK